MSISQILPADSRPFKTDNEFTATFNAPTVNRYDFNIAANKNVVMLDLRPSCIYFLERVNFSANITEQAFHEGQVSASDRIRLSIKYQTKSEAVYPTPIPFFNFLKNFEIHQFAGGTGNTSEKLTLDCSGSLKQVAKMLSVPTITIFVSWSIYQVKDSEWVQAYQNGNIWRLVSGIDRTLSRRIATE